MIAVPGKNAYELILVAAHRLRSARVVMSLSERLEAEQQEREITQSWNQLPRPRPEMLVEIMPDGDEAPWKFKLDRQLVAPSLADQDLAHRLWWHLFQKEASAGTLRETDVFGIALRRLDDSLRSGEATALDLVRQELNLRKSARDGLQNNS